MHGFKTGENANNLIVLDKVDFEAPISSNGSSSRPRTLTKYGIGERGKEFSQ